MGSRSWRELTVTLFLKSNHIESLATHDGTPICHTDVSGTHNHPALSIQYTDASIAEFSVPNSHQEDLVLLPPRQMDSDKLLAEDCSSCHVLNPVNWQHHWGQSPRTHTHAAIATVCGTENCPSHDHQ